ncbi:vWA domain-containing protein [Dactylosporangium sp. CA-092794]|uniref:vWA domain-containing protein n=1 Tax=Dactylosporangium sp. CA-092794 TaxID=3239929 RepID=UPI003D8F8AE4
MTHLTRQAALQQALFDLLRVRLQVAGRISRIALLGFTTETTAQFPPRGGMAQLDASSPPEVIEQFRSGVATLQADGGTDIPNALHAAADLLHRHGHPKNERLIVLVSDGANWQPAGERGTGDLRRGTEEPVSLMAHLYRNMNIRLHAIGISTREMFHRCYPDVHDPSVVPNHDLLTELLQVGGGDPTRIGGRDVLMEYFSGVGTGVVHRVTTPLMPRPVADLDSEARRMLRAAGPGGDHAAVLPVVTEEYGRVRRDLIAASHRVFAVPVIEQTSFGQADEALRKAVRGSNPARSLLYVAKVLMPDEGVGHQMSSIRAWRALLEGVSGAAGTQSPDLSAVARACGAVGTEPTELVVALIKRLTAALADIVQEANTLPNCQPDAGQLPGNPAMTPIHPRRGGGTVVGDVPSRNQPTLSVMN